MKTDIQFTEAGTMAPTSIDLKKLGLSREDVATAVSELSYPLFRRNSCLFQAPTPYTPHSMLLLVKFTRIQLLLAPAHT